MSTDKAANPRQYDGGSKRIMEMFLMRESLSQNLSMARFANVAFSDGSLLHGFNQRFLKQQPIAAPHDIRRYFVSSQESGELLSYVMSTRENRDIFFPKLSENLHLITFSQIAVNYLEQRGFEPFHCNSEDEARNRCGELIKLKSGPVTFLKVIQLVKKTSRNSLRIMKNSLDMEVFKSIGIIKNEAIFDPVKLSYFEKELMILKRTKIWDRRTIVDLFHEIIPDFTHKETGKYLDQRM